MVSSRSWQGALTCGGACGCSGESSLLGAVEKATAEAEKHGDRSEKLSALVAEARVMIEQARAVQAERARAAAEAAAAAAAVSAVERLKMEEEMAALALTMEEETLRLQAATSAAAANALRMQQMRAQLGCSVVSPAASSLQAAADEENMCVLCFDAPKDHIILPCYHVCVCEACANLLTQMDKPTCPICRAAIQQTNKVFHS